jgi:large subunit ribosomal protein L25
MEELVLEAKKREAIGKKVKALRQAGGLPAIIYGREVDPIPVTLDDREVNRIMSGITSSQLVVVDVEGDRYSTLVRDRQRDPIRGNLLHIDFLAVSMTEKLRASVVIELEGDSPAVKEGGIIVTGQEVLEVQSLPTDLPERILVDISQLENIGDAIYVRDLVLSSDVEVLTDLDEMVALITHPAAVEEEVEEEEIEEYDEDLEPEVIERGKKEDEGDEAE